MKQSFATDDLQSPRRALFHGKLTGVLRVYGGRHGALPLCGFHVKQAQYGGQRIAQL